MKRWRVGIIGCGWAGEQHAPAIAALPERAEVCALADVQEAPRVFRKYKTWLDYLHRMSNVEVEKETLRQRGVIKSSFTWLPRSLQLAGEDKAELNQILRDFGLL